MNVSVSKSKNTTIYYLSKSVRIGNKTTTKTIEKIGTYDEIKTKCGDMDPLDWAKQYAARRTAEENKSHSDIIIKNSSSKLIDKNVRRSCNIGYLFLQDIYYSIGLDKICHEISDRYKFEFDLNAILSMLVYSRIIAPGSKKSSLEQAQSFLEQPEIKLHQVYRGLEVLAKENDFLQSRLYQNSESVLERNKGVLYYDCTNYYFEIEDEDDFRKYGVSKEHRPNPIVQMGLFMDADGIPLSFSLFNCNENVQPSMTPLEQHLIVTFSLKYKKYQQNIRERQIERARNLVEKPSSLKKNKANYPKRFVNQDYCTADGEVTSHTLTSLNEKQIATEEKYDGFYVVCTNLEDDVPSIVRINQKRWEIEECFRIMKSEFKARPVYLSLKDRITAHFMTCFIALIIYRILEKKLDRKYTCDEMIKTLRDMNMLIYPGEGYVPEYTRTDLTDHLHETFGFRTDYQITSQRNMKKICTATKK